ncbi:hypothetical protein BBP40_000173 [Aspergillus hancockii]|nr:hypothetical protein BBP40_000173 [Aspergillus hancockii]
MQHRCCPASDFGVSSPTFRITAWVTFALSVSWSLMTILIGFLNCRPLNYNWDLQDPAGHCGNQNAVHSAVGRVDIFAGVMIILIPIPMVLRLKMPLSKKLAILGIFALGILTIIITILRTVTMLNVDFTTIV